MVEASASFMDKVEAAAGDAVVYGGSVGVADARMEDEMAPVEPLPEPPDEGGPVAWPMPEFCPLTVDGALKESFLETLWKDAAPEMERPAREADEALSPESRPSSSKRHRSGTASPSSRSSPYRNILQVFQQCRQDVVGETLTKNY
ncbi:uncharacterized protein LOC100278008 [Zea mays]|uniref:Uncharacterized protein n=1 Tax=Zea mays TaxID=4577 RepID=K7VQV0_MAIZE|nr:uncharacterized protein LOC100278008 [Zea mays]AQL01215.1 hypothetical protein ZEAMMB73_Zm00001d044972 [Zea mays]|eukprot:NP_001144482.2 uncharacterized protein LOC100278008 [Zea mays]